MTRSGWLRDLGLGMRFAFSGGREGWVRTLLTALGVGLGVALLLGAASVPTLLHERDARGDARQLGVGDLDGRLKKSDRTMLARSLSSGYRDDTVDGYLLRPEGAHPPLPPGVDKLPGPGEMVVSPALKKLLDSPDGTLLKERYDYRIVGTIHDAGLESPFHLYLYAGSDTLADNANTSRLDHFGVDYGTDEMDPILVVLIVLACMVLLVPVAIFIATAVRFGGERRDRRLAALRLVGADARMTRRTAAGEALFGTLLGIGFGIGFFLAGRQLFAVVKVWRLDAFPSDFSPVPVLGALILLAVPLAAIAVTVFALRSVTIEPLGVVRSGRPRARRLWWRLPVPVFGALLLLTTGAGDTRGRLGVARTATGIGLVLLGLVLVLPWLVEAVVRRLRGGPVPWQLAVRRLQLSSNGASRAVAGITIAVAGGIALQMYMSGIDGDFTQSTGQDPSRAQFGAYADASNGKLAERMVRDFEATKGVRSVIGTVDTWVTPAGAKPDADGVQRTVTLSVGTCATLRELAKVPSCHDGDVFRVTGTDDTVQDAQVTKDARPGARLDLGDSGALRWTLPKDTRAVKARRDPGGHLFGGILATPSAVDIGRVDTATTTAQIQVDLRVPDAAEYVRNTGFRLDPGMRMYAYQGLATDEEYARIRRGLFTAAALTMTLIAASMLVSQIEQLRDRRRLLSVLVAYGTRRSTLAWSVLWQTAIPVVLGMTVAVGGGLVLGRLMLRMAGKQVTDWLVFLPLTGVGAAAIAAVTLLSLPPLYRLMRPEGLRTE
ncbi:FtsX-like permease family protein [Streptomyces sp. VRA16 Mangrove soil]|uniref:ABC transporter permease n=1 Tax=Streptomyces sp. VRA16 Mangrove soil TaxID=2817434 RepID=UPI001A9D645B|nr:FtsX-like permease family protein [Streptomyces sp. VRA16 Mangrove soil]MBO1334645.1 ABC transporter permease [Streptomyces sp. VRA16 Mangrove soil]